MAIKFVDTRISGLKIIIPNLFEDNRGNYTKIYEKSCFAEHGISCSFSETSEIVSHRGVLRGMHYQTVDSQAKLVHVIRGMIYDVAIDLRPNSTTFGKYEGFFLEGNDEKIVYIPEGFAHGFLALEENTIFTYQCSGVYRPEYCGGIIWNDPDIGIRWPTAQIDKIILSEKDQHNLRFVDFKKMLESNYE